MSQQQRAQARKAAGERKPTARSTSTSRSGSSSMPDLDASRAPENAISPVASAVRARRPEASRARAQARAEASEAEVARAPARTLPVPEDIRGRFVIKRNTYYFPGGEPAFVDRGDRLITRGEHPEVIASLAAIAQARGWREITISGSEAFRQQMALAARRAGLCVRGEALAFEKSAQAPPGTARAPRATDAPAREPASTAPAAAQATPPQPAPRVPRRRAAMPELPAGAKVTTTPRQWRGRLIDHGAAPYRRQAGREMSYFVRLRTHEGERTLWGADLKRALQAALSRPQPGDEVVLRRVEAGRSTSRRKDRQAPGERAAAAAHRYAIETRDFFDERERLSRVVRDASLSPKLATHHHPQLAGTYLQLRLAELIAQRLKHPQDQRRFVHLVRNAMADAIARGEPMKILELRARGGARTATQASPARTAAPLRE
ncbi:hypothetical protein JM946_13680 [Steroidobacter sp. S1-65]|uniref:Large polyvalent protein-associated domain-containing protein n=1 Tax=Steroidobacter gossypii TaxID=2805490 RepID=A0ABS1WXS6_9GAMM|nr:LPD7 domain-containing protein [Steroidobacter gossypii]MBM0105786.1 hypothetical protein [Steroidobacter gossypii]